MMNKSGIAILAALIAAALQTQAVLAQQPGGAAGQPANPAPNAPPAPAPSPNTNPPAPQVTVPPMAPAPPSPAVTPTPKPASYLLRLKFTKGETIAYQMSTVTSVSITTANGTIPVNTAVDAVMTQRVKSIRPTDGAAKLSILMSNYHVVSNGQTASRQSVASIAKMSNATEYVDSRGRISGVNVSGNNPASGFLDNSQMSSALSSLSFPAGRVHVGDTWSRHGGNSKEGGMAINGTYTVTGAWTTNGKTFVSVHADYSVTMSYQISQGQASVLISGPISGSSDTVIDLARGVYRVMKGTSSGQLSMTMNGNPLGSETVSTTVSQTYVKSTLP